MMFLPVLFACLDPNPQESGGGWALRWRLDGGTALEGFGRGIAGISDLEGDSASDVIVGIEGWDGVVESSGKVTVYSGATGLAIFEFVGTEFLGSLGHSVANVGDVNGDGVEDIAGGAPFESPGGAAYVWSGADGRVLHRFTRSEIGAIYGRYIAGAGDVDGDGAADVLVGSERSSVFGPAAGASFVYSGATGAQLLVLGQSAARNAQDGDGLGDINADGLADLVISDFLNGGSVAVYSGADGSVLYRIPSVAPFDGFGGSLANIRDIDRDGVNDFIVGAPAPQAGVRKGRAYVYSGVSGMLLMDLRGNVDHDEFGFDVAGGMDVNGDGYPDMVVGAHFGGSLEQGAAFVHSGLDGRLLAELVGETPFDLFGHAVAMTPDVNSDGLGDVVVYSHGADYGASNAGSVNLLELHSYLTADPRKVSAAAGETVTFALDFPDSEAGKVWQLLLSTDRAGQITIGGVHIPLMLSPLLRRTLLDPPAIFSSTSGVLDPSGDAMTIATLAAGQASAWVGFTLRFAAVSLDLPSNPRLSSAGVRIAVVP
ncbi:MAG: hypothetical protein EYC70_01170 [Planctomycetota bacterium]|nr:MAG: hypothetical protein EYC70_01170 [Planctomycetota bacterium]